MTTEAITHPPVVQFALPFPPLGLSPNARLSWQEKRPIVRDYRRTCMVDALNVRRDLERQGMTFPLRVPVTMIVTFVLTSQARRRDWTNLIGAWKAGEDGIVDAGVLADDSIQTIGRIGYETAQGSKQEVWVRIEGAS